MCQKAALSRVLRTSLRSACLAGIFTGVLAAQTVEWRRVGNAALDAGLAGLATGPVERVWYSADGGKLFILSTFGRQFETEDFETWSLSTDLPPAKRELSVAGSRQWQALTHYRGRPILGDGLADLAVSPRDPEEVAIANRFGVWRSLDGGLSWSGLNDSLPNLPLRKLARQPGPGRRVHVILDAAAGVAEAIWSPGQREGWVPVAPEISAREVERRHAVAVSLGAPVTALAASQDFLYAGGSEGRLWVSTDRGRTWRPFRIADGGAVEDLFVDASEPRMALAALAAIEGVRGARIVRTTNGGIFWDDLTADLPPGSVHSVTADPGTGAIYAGTDAGLYFTYGNLAAAGPATPWRKMRGLPEAAVRDVELDEAGNQIYAAVDGYGLYAAMAPHRFLDPKVVNAADQSARPAAPGTLLSVLGSRVAAARSGELEFPVLAATEAESQIQVPFEVTGTALSLALTSAAADGTLTRREMALGLLGSSPAIFTDRDGVPMILDADRGVLLDPMTPARSGSRIQILATGLGRVVPEWPTGLAAPLENPPKVAANVKVVVDRVPAEVTRATLAPGYVGFYLIEVQLPDIVNAGPAELYIEAGGQQSGRVSIPLLP